VGEDLIQPVLDSINETEGGWPVLVLLIVIASIVYLARYVLSRQIRINEQRVQERKQEFEAQLQRERDNSANYQNTTIMMVQAFDKNSAAIAEFSSILRPMSETLHRIDRHLDQSGDYRQRRKGEQ
jgi:ABC-type multidrug transport system fused ATPase/permease subunit